ncbi:xanthine dehydrogenase family protein subunit M [Herbiconiux sp. P15]|uniref:FAD binding domain-containing protein n=1 Tax=Herbiconiux liukaitaii TaxID=3342799 RepID=UPI0035BA117D
MKAFEYERAADTTSALTLLAARPGSKPLAGGTNLVDLMRLGVETPGTLVDINRVDFGGIEVAADGGLRIGAGVRNSDLAGDVTVRTRHPLLAEAVLAGASGQLRNMASVAGNLLQRTRCVYFADLAAPCNKREPGSGCSAIAGVSRELAILGASPSCIATFPGDMAVALSALDATVTYETLEGATTVGIDELFRLPGERPELDTTLPEGALITSISVPAASPGLRSTYRKARDRRSFAFGLATVAAALRVEEGVVAEIRIAFGGVAHRPWRARIAESMLLGRSASGQAFDEAVEQALAAELAQARPTADNAFKVELVTRLATGALLDLRGPQ